VPWATLGLRRPGALSLRSLAGAAYRASSLGSRLTASPRHATLAAPAATPSGSVAGGCRFVCRSPPSSASGGSRSLSRSACLIEQRVLLALKDTPRTPPRSLVWSRTDKHWTVPNDVIPNRAWTRSSFGLREFDPFDARPREDGRRSAVRRARGRMDVQFGTPSAKRSELAPCAAPASERQAERGPPDRGAVARLQRDDEHESRPWWQAD